MPFLMSDVSTATPRADDCRGAKAIGENAEHPDAKSNRIETFNSFIFVVMVFQGQVVRCNITPPQGKNVVFLHFPQEQVGTPKQPGTTQISISFVRQVPSHGYRTQCLITRGFARHVEGYGDNILAIHS